MKKCPYCAELVQDDAKKCKHCGEWFENIAQSLFKKAKSFIDEQGLRHQAKLEAKREHLIKVKIGELLNFLDSLEERDDINSVNYKKEERLFSIGYVGGGEREGIGVQIISNNTIKIESYQPIDYKGHIGVLTSPGIGEGMFAVLYDLYSRYYKGPVKPIFRN